MTLTDYIGAVPDVGQQTIAHIQKSSLLDGLGRVLSAGKETLRVAGRTVKRNADLISWSVMYISLVGEVAAVTFDLVYHPEHFGKIVHSTFVDLPIPLERAYAAIGVTAAALLPVWALGAHGLISRRYE